MIQTVNTKSVRKSVVSLQKRLLLEKNSSNTTLIFQLMIYTLINYKKVVKILKFYK